MPFLRKIALYSLSAWLLVEGVLWGRFFWRKAHPMESGLRLEAVYHNNVKPHTVLDPKLGFRSRPNGDVTATLSKGDTVVAKARYRSDSIGRRITSDEPLPIQIPLAHRPEKKFALFVGCSYTFGNGVSDNETFPSRFAQRRRDYHAYNYGFGGYGAQHVLLLLQEEELPQQITEHTGSLLYVFMDDHLKRINPPLRSYYQQRDAGLPLPELGKVSVYLDWRWYLGVSRVFREWISSDAFDEQLAIEKWLSTVKQAEKEFNSRFQSDDFWVVFFPGSEAAAKLKPRLQQAQISYLDYSTLFNKSDTKEWIPGYEHPSADGYSRAASALARDLP